MSLSEGTAQPRRRLLRQHQLQTLKCVCTVNVSSLPLQVSWVLPRALSRPSRMILNMKLYTEKQERWNGRGEGCGDLLREAHVSAAHGSQVPCDKGIQEENAFALNAKRRERQWQLLICYQCQLTSLNLIYQQSCELCFHEKVKRTSNLITCSRLGKTTFKRKYFQGHSRSQNCQCVGDPVLVCDCPDCCWLWEEGSESLSSRHLELLKR